MRKTQKLMEEMRSVCIHGTALFIETFSIYTFLLTMKMDKFH